MILHYYFILHGKITRRRWRRETLRPTDRPRRILLFTPVRPYDSRIPEMHV